MRSCSGTTILPSLRPPLLLCREGYDSRYLVYTSSTTSCLIVLVAGYTSSYVEDEVQYGTVARPRGIALNGTCHVIALITKEGEEWLENEVQNEISNIRISNLLDIISFSIIQTRDESQKAHERPEAWRRLRAQTLLVTKKLLFSHQRMAMLTVVLTMNKKRFGVTEIRK